MIQEQKTEEEFGYNVSNLTLGSKKYVIVECDYCNEIYKANYKNYNNSRKIVEKDSCKKCRYKKREDISMAQYGVKNSAQRPEVRKKISENVEGFDEKRLKTMEEKYGTRKVMHNDIIRKRQQQSVMDKYGVENVSQIKEVRDKVRKTNLEKYGNEEFLASDEGKRKKLEGVQNKYGVDNVFQNEDIKIKIKETNQEKYGVDSPMQSEHIRKKSIESVRKLYGVDNVGQSDIIKEQIKNTVVDRYGVDCVFKSKEVRKKIEQTNIERYGHKVPTQNKEIYQKILDTKQKNGDIKTYDGKTMSELAEEHGKPYSTFVAQVARYGFDTAIQIQPRENALEKVMEIFLIEENIEYQKHFVVDKRKSDFMIPSHNIIIETDGLYWHSDNIIKKIDYHSIKRDTYIKNGYTPLFFREDEIYNKFDIVKSIILNKLGKSRRIFARKCNIETLTSAQSKLFFEQNHLMGKGRGLTYALTYQGEVVCAMAIRRVRGDDWEISRFSPALNTQVVGGFSRLIKHFFNNNKYDSLFTFIDLRYGRGEYLPSLGFKHANTSLSFRWTNCIETCHRMKFKGNSGYENRFVKIWDCGQAKYCIT